MPIVMEDMPTISVIIPAHNAAPWIAFTLQSIQAQSFQHWECLIINDGSTDNTVQQIQPFLEDSRFLLIQQPQQGVSAARNHGLSRACGQYIAFLDSDDIWQSKTLELLVTALQKSSESVLAWGKYKRFESHTGRFIPQPATCLQQPDNIWHAMLIDSMLPIGTFLVRAEEATLITFNSELRIGEDRDWLLRLMTGKQAINIPQTLLYYRQHESSAVHNYEQFLKDEAIMLAPHLQDTMLPHSIITMAYSAYDFHSAILLSKIAGKKAAALKLYMRAVLRTPWYIDLYLRPIHKFWQKILPKQILPEVKKYLYP